MEPSGQLLIFGASARAAAFSALRAGLRPWCADLFADLDLQARCPAMRLPGRYPHSFRLLNDTELPGPWMYTGGLENWPILLRQMARRRPLWGNSGDELLRARHPQMVMETLQRAGLPAPMMSFNAEVLPRPLSLLFRPLGSGWKAPAPSPYSSRRWLVKPLGSAGGAGIRFWGAEAPADPRRFAPFYYQEYIEGESCAAVYVGDGRRADFLGLTRQLVGADFLHAGPFRYCGSIGPLDPATVQRPDLEQLGTVLASGCGLRGLFGVDGVLRDGVFWPVEVNPRYTASVEVLEYATGLRALDCHRRAFTPGSAACPVGPARPAAGYVGKAILFARADLVFPAEGPWRSVLDAPGPVEVMPAYADIPAAGAQIAAGKPVLTFFVRADSVSSCEEALRQTAADLDRRLFGG